jgi:hypothetical protein
VISANPLGSPHQAQRGLGDDATLTEPSPNGVEQIRARACRTRQLAAGAIEEGALLARGTGHADKHLASGARNTGAGPPRARRAERVNIGGGIDQAAIARRAAKTDFRRRSFRSHERDLLAAGTAGHGNVGRDARHLDAHPRCETEDLCTIFAIRLVLVYECFQALQLIGELHPVFRQLHEQRRKRGGGCALGHIGAVQCGSTILLQIARHLVLVAEGLHLAAQTETSRVKN